MVGNYRTVVRRLIKFGLCIICSAGLALLSIGFYIWNVIPFDFDALSCWPKSTVLKDVNGEVITRTLASNGDWRMPVSLDEVSPHFINALIAVEDQRFYKHLGVDPLAIARATLHNLCARKIVSGASTIDMQVCRMVGGRPRTFWSKMVEAVHAVQMNRFLSKQEVLRYYINITPYGGNVRGVEAASWEYFAKNSSNLTLGEAALLAGIPQAPEFLRPDRYLWVALKRRKEVFDRMESEGFLTLRKRLLAESLPLRIRSAVNLRQADHFSALVLQQRRGDITTSLDLEMQYSVEGIVEDYSKGITEGSDLAVVIIDIETGGVRAMVGSSDFFDKHKGQVNGVTSLRSPGSALKPFVFALAFDRGRLAANSLLYDGPLAFGGWTPRNFDSGFQGLVTAEQALKESLNIPAIWILRELGLGSCSQIMESSGICSYGRAMESGLSLATGGVETKLVDLCNAYAMLGRGGVWKPYTLVTGELVFGRRVFQANTCLALSELLSSNSRGLTCVENEDTAWFMWKTGTSSHRRDALALGHNGRYAIGVWLGCFSGRGHVSFIGSSGAEPIIRVLFNHPYIKNVEVPRVANPVVVDNPIIQPDSPVNDLRITEPLTGSEYVEAGADFSMFAKACGGGKIKWFLNGTYIGECNPIVVSAGRGKHRLNCVAEGGRFDSVCFTVR